ncbi:MAG: hypothetical protein ABFD08_15240 [Syntrophomonas sp.]
MSEKGMEKYYGKEMLIPVEVLPETVTQTPSFKVTGKYVEIEGKRFYLITRWTKL